MICVFYDTSFPLLSGMGAAASVVNTSGRHGATLPFAACQVRHLDQLKYLAKVMGFEVQVTNIPRVCLSDVFSVPLGC